MLLRATRCGVRRVRPLRRAVSTSAQESPSDPLSLKRENALLREELDALRNQLQRGNLVAAAAREDATQRTAFVGAQSAYTTEPHFWYPHVDDVPRAMPCFRVMDDLGQVSPGAEAHVPNLSREVALACMMTMIRVNEFDKIYLESQRQGRISFYLTSRGEEAASVGSAVAIQPNDWVLPQYRELGLFFWRGFSFAEVANQLVANALDPAHGRQLPLHLGSKSKHIQYIKSPLATQCPHAAGVAYAMKLKRTDQVALAYIGEGSASEGDFPSALNIAAVHGCPAVYFCRNNG